MGLSGFLAELDYISEGIGKPLDPGQYNVSTVTDKDYCSLSIDKLNNGKIAIFWRLEFHILALL